MRYRPDRAHRVSGLALICLAGLASAMTPGLVRRESALVAQSPLEVTEVPLVIAQTPYARANPRAVCWLDDRVCVADPNSTAEGAASIQVRRLRKQEWVLLNWFGDYRAARGLHELTAPHAVAAADGGYWVSDSGAGVILRLSVPAGRAKAIARACASFADARIRSVSDLAAAADGGVYALDGMNGAIARIGRDGSSRHFPCLRLRGAQGLDRGFLLGDRSRDALLVANSRTDCIIRIPLDTAGNPLVKQATPFLSDIRGPADVSVAPDGTVWVAQPGQARIIGCPPTRAVPAYLLPLGEHAPAGTVHPWHIAASADLGGQYKLAIADPPGRRLLVATIPVSSATVVSR